MVFSAISWGGGGGGGGGSFELEADDNTDDSIGAGQEKNYYVLFRHIGSLK